MPIIAFKDSNGGFYQAEVPDENDVPAWWGELVTGRLKRYAYEPDYFGTWRQKFAFAFATILDAAYPSGKHI